MQPNNPTPQTTPAPSVPTSPSGQWEGAWSAVAFGFTAIKNNPVLPLVYIVITSIALFVDNKERWMSGSSGHYPSSTGWVSLLTIVLFSVALPKFAAAAARGERKSLGGCFGASVGTYINAVAATLVMGFAVVLSAVLFFIPVVWVGPMVVFLVYAVVDKGLRGGTALRYSKDLGSPNKGKIWALVGVGLLATIAGSIVGTICVAVLSTAGVILAYIILTTTQLAAAIGFGKLYCYLADGGQAPASTAPAPATTPGAPTIA